MPPLIIQACLSIFVGAILTGCGADEATDSNSAPVAVAGFGVGLPDNSIAIRLIGRDYDGDSLSYHLTSQPLHGTLTGTPPSLTYTPNATYEGEDKFNFKVNDGEFDSNTATVTLTISTSALVNQAPTANDLTVSLRKDTSSAITLAGTDVENSALIFRVTSQPTYGTLTGTVPNLTYTPDNAYVGADSFIYVSNDGELDSSAATVTLTITQASSAVNEAPTANDLGISLIKNTSSAVTLSGSDAEGATLTFRITSLPTHGVLTGTVLNLTYTPDSDYVGADSFNYISYDGELYSEGEFATVAITVMTAVVNKDLISPLNDTGITFGGNYPEGNNTSCIGEMIAEQDCSHGRDATHNDDSDGHAGFSYTKLDVGGNALMASAIEWSCVKDNVTGLVWEVKVGGNDVIGDEGLHDADDRYNWYNTDPSTNGGRDGYANDDGAICYGYDANISSSYCNTQAYVERVNSMGLCGANDWRMPSINELVNLVNHNRKGPSIDLFYFPATQDFFYSSSSPVASSGSYASGPYGNWIVSFSHGSTSYGSGKGRTSARLVRIAQ